jgi:hypothetical protein
MPTNAQDAEAARELVSLGPVALAPVIPEMLRQLKNLDSPVCEIYSEFFARFGERYVTEIGELLGRSTMPEAKWVIVSRILPSWHAGAVGRLRGALGMLMTAPDFWGTDLWCIRLLARHSLLERSALEQWLEFKRKRLSALNEMAAEVAKEMAAGK